MDSIDKATFEVDSIDTDYGPHPVGFLTLEGDFVDAFSKYLDEEHADSPDYSRVTLRMGRSVAEELVNDISGYLHD